MGTHPIFESDFDCLTDQVNMPAVYGRPINLEQLVATCRETNMQVERLAHRLNAVAEQVTDIAAHVGSAGETQRQIIASNGVRQITLDALLAQNNQVIKSNLRVEAKNAGQAINLMCLDKVLTLRNEFIKKLDVDIEIVLAEAEMGPSTKEDIATEVKSLARDYRQKQVILRQEEQMSLRAAAASLEVKISPAWARQGYTTDVGNVLLGQVNANTGIRRQGKPAFRLITPPEPTSPELRRPKWGEPEPENHVFANPLPSP